MAEFDAVAAKYNIQMLADASPAEVQQLAARLNITSPKRMNDLSHLAAAQKHGVGLVTGDKGLFKAALRDNYLQVEYRIFEYPQAQRINAYRSIRDFITNHHPGLSPHRFTGSGVGR